MFVLVLHVKISLQIIKNSYYNCDSKKFLLLVPITATDFVIVASFLWPTVFTLSIVRCMAVKCDAAMSQ